MINRKGSLHSLESGERVLPRRFFDFELLGLNEKVGGNRTAPNCIPIKGSKDLGLFRAW
tara:strand:- start:348 stop:524 length:177 start_codon:yes stop_codon:yes gene_type:complete